MKIDRVIEYLQQLPEDTEILQWDTQNDLQLPKTVGTRTSIQLAFFSPSNVVVGVVSRPELEVGSGAVHMRE